MRAPSLAVLALLVTGVTGCAAPAFDDSPPRAAPADEPPAAAPDDGWPPPSLLPETALTPFEQAIGERMRAVVEVTVEVEIRSGDEVTGHGSGVLVSPDGDVLTAAHVVNHEDHSFRVVLPGGQSRPAVVAARDEAHDAALLHAPGEPTPFARPPARTRPAGEWVVCSGYGGDVAPDRVPTGSAGVIVERSYAWTVWNAARSPWSRQVENGPTFWGMLRLDCATVPGMSGGPVVDLDGELLGVVVGSGGVASSIEAIRHLLPAAGRSPEAPPESAPRAALPPLPSPVHEGDLPSRAVAIEPLFGDLGAGRSVVELEIASSPWSSRRFPAVLVSTTGLAVAPAVRLTRITELGATVPATDLTVVGYPGAHCDQIVAVRDELALIRLSGLFPSENADGAEPGEGLCPVGPPGAAAVGEVIAVLGAAPGRRTVGFVTSVERHPGTVAPPAPRGGCGTMHRMFEEEFPIVPVASALAHDAEMPAYGALLVDRRGRPIGVEVGSGHPGLDFAVPWTEVLARFGEWLPSPPAP
jgi:Trypsin-like peptidase domain